MTAEMKFFGQRINFQIQNGLFERKNELVVAVIGPFAFLFNQEKMELFATTSENVKRFGTVVEAKVPITHLNIMDAFVYFLSEILFDTAGYKLAEKLFPHQPPLLMTLAFNAEVLTYVTCPEGANVRSVFRELLFVATTSATQEDLTKLYLKLKIEVDEYYRISDSKQDTDSVMAQIQAAAGKKE